MVMSSTETGAAPGPASLWSRFVGILTSPKATFQTVVAHPRWFGMLALTCVALAVMWAAFLLTKVGQNAWLDSMTTGPWARDMPDEQYAGMQRIAPYVGYFAIIQMLVFVPIFNVIIAGILYGVFNVVLGGTATFKQLFAVFVHCGPVGVVAQAFTVLMNYTGETMTSKTNLGVLRLVSENTFIGRLLGTIDLFIIWQVIVLAIGLGVLYRRPTQPIAMGLFATYAVIALIIAAVMTSFGGSN
jgi:membrane protein, antimicrobial resistance system